MRKVIHKEQNHHLSLKGPHSHTNNLKLNKLKPKYWSIYGYDLDSDLRYL